MSFLVTPVVQAAAATESHRFVSSLRLAGPAIVLSATATQAAGPGEVEAGP
ncbi:hypothetical protein PJI17_09445 [Mycobacterium kansasii]|uniref:Uncharacterized protein n=1 Tax=Mycobacterium kansasii TaxID=1768 RepID=A0A1V3WNW3_MYCKA|nr:hypothetical protein I547_1944 [Mycobacterium kansasii 824]KEP44191.1 hypothetical protein MKSMC1_05520 [Mycobacterium kansasii]OOK68645.1 hypothetical protein BZL30_7198 [Mycobacterium kansasii]